MRIVFFGSPVEASGALTALIDDGHTVTAAYTQPDRKAGRGRMLRPTPVRTTAEASGIPVFTPRSLRNNPDELNRLRELNADVFVVVAYGRILPPELLEVPPMGVVNVHPSLLPKYRGPSPVVTAILDGQSETGVSVMLLDEGMDTGPVLAQSPPVKLDGTEKGAELQARLFKEGASMLPAVLNGLEDGSVQPQPQNDSLGTVSRLLDRSDGEIDWADPFEKIDRMIRAYSPWPGTFTSWGDKTLKIVDAELSDTPSTGVGVVFVDGGNAFVGCGSGSILLKRIQLQGRQAVAAADFLNGQPEFDGATLGSGKN